MSGDFKNPLKTVGKWVGKGLDAIGLGTPKMPKEPQVPQIDDAKKQRTEYDRIRRRRGVLANIFGGNRSGGGGTVSQKTLLGE